MMAVVSEPQTTLTCDSVPKYQPSPWRMISHSAPAAPVHRHFVVALCCSPGKAAAELAFVIKKARESANSPPRRP